MFQAHSPSWPVTVIQVYVDDGQKEKKLLLVIHPSSNNDIIHFRKSLGGGDASDICLNDKQFILDGQMSESNKQIDACNGVRGRMYVQATRLF